MAPKIIISGDTWKTSYQRSAYPNTEWSASLFLEGPTATAITGSARTEDTGFDFVLTPSASNAMTEGTYRYYVRFTSGSEAYTRITDEVRVKDNPASLADKTIFAEQMVTLIEACLKGQLNADEQIAAASISVGGRSLAFLDREDLIRERNYWIRKLNKLRTDKTAPVQSRPVDLNSLLGNRY